MKVTIKEVAKLAGVSPSTVSRVISDSSRISDETKKQVRDIMKELGYHPNAIARSLVSRSTNTLGIVMPQSTERAFLNPFFPQVLSGISVAAHENNYCMLVSTGTTEEEQLSSITNIVMGGRVDGVIIMYSSVDNDILEAVKSLKVPVLIIGKPIEPKGVLYVDNDNVDASYKVTQKLIERGHRNIALITGPLKMMVSLDRLDGYRNALISNGFQLDKNYIRESEFTKEAGYVAMKDLLQKNDKITGLVITDDVMAFGAIDAIKEHGLRIPEDIEIISFNNIPLSEFCNPSLTSVDISATTLGYESAKLMIDKINGKEENNKVIVSTKIIYRDSFKKGV